jgi:hypothetical protein
MGSFMFGLSEIITMKIHGLKYEDEDEKG